MAGLKEIRQRIASVKNTKKITYAMKLVSAAKLRKAQEAVKSAHEYTEGLSRVLKLLSTENADRGASQVLLEPRATVSKIRVLVVGGGRGLCGGYNTNINRKVVSYEKILSENNPSAEIDYVVLGRKPAEFFRRTKRPYVKSYEKLSEDPSKWPLVDIFQELETAFIAGEFDELHFIYTKFKSALSVIPSAEQLLPLRSEDLSAVTSAEDDEDIPGSVLFEPSASIVFDAIVPRIIRSRVLQAALDAKASEHGSRMTAMDSATKNAGEIIEALQLTYNKLRQGGITSELLDIIGGAEAIN